jgi:hypothetical protein
MLRFNSKPTEDCDEGSNPSSFFVTTQIEQGDRLAFRFKTTGTRDNSPFVFEGVNILRIEGDKVVEDWVYFDATGVRGRIARAQAV